MESTWQDKKELGESFLSSLQKQDWELLRNIVSPGVVWSFPGSNLMSGQAKGVNAVTLACKDLIGYGPTFVLKHVLYGVSDIVLVIEVNASRGDLNLNTYFSATLTTEDKRVTRIQISLSDIAMADAFFTDRSCHSRFRPTG
jgi:hypothetical protein